MRLCNQTRRGFLGGIVAAGAAGKLFTAAAADYDDDLAVLLSDVHLCGTGRPADRRFTCGEFDKRIAEILAMRPLPRRVIHFGDLSLENGAVEDYRLAKEKIALLEAAGIEFVHMMGNHDRRGKFASVFPDVGRRSPVSGRYVSVVPFRSFDLLLLDSLDAPEERKDDVDPGRLNDDQQEWLAQALPAWKRPVIVGAHHPATSLTVRGDGLVDLLVESPNAIGWINGHEHLWKKSVLCGWGRREDTIRSLGLPSAGFFFDIGFVELRVTDREAVARLHQSDYFFFGPGKDGERRPRVWQTIVEDNRNEVCTFPIERQIRPWSMSRRVEE